MRFGRVNSEQFDPNGSIEIKNSKDVAIVDFDDASKQSRGFYAGAKKGDEEKSQDEIAPHKQ